MVLKVFVAEGVRVRGIAEALTARGRAAEVEKS